MVFSYLLPAGEHDPLLAHRSAALTVRTLFVIHHPLSLYFCEVQKSIVAKIILGKEQTRHADQGLNYTAVVNTMSEPSIQASTRTTINATSKQHTLAEDNNLHRPCHLRVQATPALLSNYLEKDWREYPRHHEPPRFP